MKPSLPMLSSMDHTRVLYSKKVIFKPEVYLASFLCFPGTSQLCIFTLEICGPFWIFCRGLKSVSGILFLPGCPVIPPFIFWKDFYFLYCITFSPLCQTSVNYPVGFFQGSLFYSLFYLHCYQSSWSFLTSLTSRLYAEGG